LTWRVEPCHQEEIVSSFSACQRFQRPLSRKAIIQKFPEERSSVTPPRFQEHDDSGDRERDTWPGDPQSPLHGSSSVFTP